jgi:hypothetical protein
LTSNAYYWWGYDDQGEESMNQTPPSEKSYILEGSKGGVNTYSMLSNGGNIGAFCTGHFPLQQQQHKIIRSFIYYLDKFYLEAAARMELTGISCPCQNPIPNVDTGVEREPSTNCLDPLEGSNRHCCHSTAPLLSSKPSS